MSISHWTQVISISGILSASFYIFDKSVSCKIKFSNKIVAVLLCILWAVFYAFKPSWIPLLMIRTFGCVFAIITIYIATEIKFDTIVATYLLSYGISSVIFYISGLVISLTFAPFLSVGFASNATIDFNHPIYLLIYTLIAIIQFFTVCIFFRIRRFKFGFPFLQNRFAVAIALIIAGIIMAIVSFVVTQRGNNDTYRIVMSFIFVSITIGAGIYIWIRRSLKIYQRKKAWERNEEIYQQEKEELTRELEHYKELHETVRIANHKMIHRQVAAERSVLRLMEIAREHGLPVEFSDELTVELDRIRRLSQEYRESVGIKVRKKLPSTNIKAVDDLFELFAERFSNAEIDFNLKVNGSIIYMTENIIEQKRLETMIGDHLQDALDAVNSGGSPVRGVLAMLGESGNYYEFSVYDSGVSFEIDTLVHLGAESVTTRASGTGIGFMTTFEAMQECGASLIIREYAPGSGFTKVVTIRFDGENKYKIETYRSGDFPVSARYAVVELA